MTKLRLDLFDSIVGMPGASNGTKCEVCGQGIADGIALYRNGPKGQIVPWRCIVHVDPQYKPDADVLDITQAIESERGT